MNEKIKNIIKGLLWGLLICTLITLCSSCATTAKVEDYYVHTSERVDSASLARVYEDSLSLYRSRIDSLVRTRLVRDSVRVRDSIVVVKNEEGQIILREVYHDSEAYHDSEEKEQLTSLLEDYRAQLQRSVLELVNTSASIDSRIHDRTEVKEKPQSLYDRIASRLFGWLVAVLACFVVAFVIHYKYGAEIPKGSGNSD